MTMKAVITMLLGTFLLLFGCGTKTKFVNSCGDGYLDPGEQCDKLELRGQTCLSLGHYIDGQLSCHFNCSFNTAECGGFCGDGILETDHGELCDLFELDDQTCQTMGFSGGALSCRSDCSFNTEGCLSVCGDGRVEPDEGCDDGNREVGDGCDAFCLVEPGYACGEEPSECDTVCGDSLIAGDEVCDFRTLSGLNCQSFGYYGGALGCSSDCMDFDKTDCARYGTCGDGMLQGPHGEDCDGAELGGATCWSLGYSQASGDLLCTEYCRFDEALCVPESSNADLATLTVNVGVMVPAFSPDTTSYALTVPMTQTSVTVSATAADPWASVAFTPSQPISQAVGENPVTVTVTAEDGTQKVLKLGVG